MKSLFVFGCIGLLAAGCADLQVGTPIATSNLTVIRSGFTTKTEVAKFFGNPLHVVQGPEGEIWVYRYASGKDNTNPQELTVSFNGNLVSTSSAR